MRCKKVKAGEWVSPRRRGYYMQCCGCGLIHRLRFRLTKNKRGHGRKIQFQAFRGEGVKMVVSCG